MVRRAHPQPNVDLSYVKRSGESSGDAGDQYVGLDRFGRVVDQRWLNPTSGTATDRFQYAYDLVSNRTSRDNLVNSAFGELYAYDDLSQLVSFQRGTLNGTKTGLTGSASRSQSWDTDAVGNFDSVTTDGTAQTRGANKQNQITSISGATTPTYDDNGNMTGDETGRQFVYDAWNRLVIVKNSSGTTLETFKYDGLNRRVSSSDGTTTTDLYYSQDWQVLSEKVGSNYSKRYVWSPVYVDAMVLRDRDTDANGTLDERLWVQQDANWNVTALVDGSGSVIERYAYDPYGVQTVYDASYTLRSGGSSYDFNHGFQGMFFDSTTGLYVADWRLYSPTLQRWVTVDPSGLGPDVNAYRFVGNDPTNGTDPSGLKVYVVQKSYRGRTSGSGGWGHVAIYVVDERDCRYVRYDGDGTPNNAFMQAFGGINKYIVGDWKPKRNPEKPQPFIKVTKKELQAEIFDLRHYLIADGKFEDEVVRLDDTAGKLKQVRHYNAFYGPNSNTYAHQLLYLANFNPPAAIPYAPGWVYSGEYNYGGLYYSVYGEEVHLNPTEEDRLRFHFHNNPPDISLIR